MMVITNLLSQHRVSQSSCQHVHTRMAVLVDLTNQNQNQNSLLIPRGNYVTNMDSCTGGKAFIFVKLQFALSL